MNDDVSMDVARSPDPTQPRESVRRSSKLLPHLSWLAITTLSIGSMYWWYEIRPEQVALRELQGTWQPVDGVFPEETARDTYLHYDDNESWRTYPVRDPTQPWRATHSRIESIRPARNFYLVRRSYGLDWGKNKKETEYIVCLNGDGLFQVVGLAPIEATRNYRVQKHVRVEQLPEQGKKALESYKEKYAAKAESE